MLGRPEHRRAARADRLRRPARDPADRARDAAGRLPAQRVPARARRARHDRGPARHARPHRRGAAPAAEAAAAAGRLQPRDLPRPRNAAMRTLAEWLDAAGVGAPAEHRPGARARGAAWRARLGLDQPRCPRSSPSPAPTARARSSPIWRRCCARAGLRTGAVHLAASACATTSASASMARKSSDAELVAAFERIEAARGDTTLTFFEYNALAALLVFARRGAVDVAVLEVGLGGRLDAANIVDADVAVRLPPSASIIATGSATRSSRSARRRRASSARGARRCSARRRCPRACSPRSRAPRRAGGGGRAGLQLAAGTRRAGTTAA